MAKVPFFNFSGGWNNGTSPFLVPQSTLTICNGVNPFYKLGALLKDPGYFLVDAQMESGKDITGLFDFHQSSTVQRTFATMNDSGDDDTQLFAKTPAGSWTEITAAETAWANKANINVEIEEMIGYAFFVGHGTTDGFISPGSVTGTTFSSTVNVGAGGDQMPNAKYIKKFRDRLYIANTDIGGTATPFRVYFSSVPSGSPLSITWTQATDFFDVGYNLEITGLGANNDRLFVFTRDSCFFYDQAQKRKIWDYGCSNHRTIQNYGPYVIWCTGDDIAVSTGGQPQRIGGSIIDFIRNGNSRNFFSALVDDEYHLYIGAVTVDGVSYSNFKLIYNFSTSGWRGRELGADMKIFAKYFDTTNWVNRLYMGDGDGKVWNKSKYTDTTIAQSDNEATLGTEVTDISVNFEITAPLGSASTTKEAENMTAYANRGGALKLMGRVLDRNSRVLLKYQPIGELTEYVNNFHVNIEKGAILQIQGAETGMNPYFSFYGFELDVEDGGNVLRKTP